MSPTYGMRLECKLKVGSYRTHFISALDSTSVLSRFFLYLLYVISLALHADLHSLHTKMKLNSPCRNYQKKSFICFFSKMKVARYFHFHNQLSVPSLHH